MYSEKYDDEMLAQADENIVFEIRSDLIAAESALKAATERIAELQADNARLELKAAHHQQETRFAEDAAQRHRAKRREYVAQLYQAKKRIAELEREYQR